MMLPEGENGLLLCEEQIQELRELRKKTVRWQIHLPRSLSALAIQSVVEHFTRFIDVPDCPLKYLPNTVVQQLLSKIASDVRRREIVMPVPLLMQVLGLLVNPNVTELDCTGFDRSNDDATVGNFLLKHALDNCPNIRKIRVRNMPKNNLNCGSHSYHYQGLYVSPSPFECFKKSWNNLTTIIMYKRDFWFVESDMRFLQEDFPNLEELHACVYIYFSPETMVNHLVKMKRLHTLYLLEVDGEECFFNEFDSEMIDFFADVAGGVPNLQNFGFAKVDKIFSTSKFIDLFGEEYPSKNILLMEELRIKEGLQRKWPKNLSVSYLTIDATNWSDTEIENLSTLESTLDLTVDCLSAQQTYKVLDCIGGRVKRLTIKKSATIILERILAACPNLEHFDYMDVGSVVQDPEYNMLPAAFKNYKSFLFYGWKKKYEEEVAFQQVYRKFLIGTEVCVSLKHLYLDQVETLAQVALEYPESLQQLCMLQVCADELNDEKCEKYCECFYQLIMCCHKLERIFFPVHKVTRMNRYLATIQSIDPHFIQEDK